MQPETRRLAAVLMLLGILVLIVAACGAPPATPKEPPSAMALQPTLSLPTATTPTLEASPTTTPAPTASPLPATATAQPSPTATATATGTATDTATPASPTPTSTVERTSTPGPTGSPTPTHTPTPTDTPAPPDTPSPTPGPSILSFQVTPAVTMNLGDVLTLSWQATGDRAEICPVAALGPIQSRCLAVPLSGSSTWTTDEKAMGYTGFALRIWLGTTSTLRVVDVKLQCQNLRPWFFPNPPQNCPTAEAMTSYAAGQYFEHGFMVWTEEPDTFYVFYEGPDADGFQTYDWVPDPGSALKPGASPDNRVGQTPPAGLFEPVSGFGMVWRGEVEGVRDDVRQRLGWATGLEFAYQSAHQCMTLSLMHYWICFLRGPQGEILRLHPDSTAQVRWVWEEW